MLLNPIIEKLKTLKLSGMAQALELQNQNISYQELGFEERFGLLVDNEQNVRDNKRLTNRLQQAKLKRNACMHDIKYKPSRCIDKTLMARLETGQWIAAHKNILIVGATGTGKSFLAEALAHNACLKGYTAHSLRLSKFLNELVIAKGDGRYLKLMATVAKYDVLILDDFGITPLTVEQRSDLLELIEERHDRKSTIVTSQMPIKHWHEFIGDTTLADAILDRLIHNAHKIDLQGESMRKILSQKEQKIGGSE
jgi:DNA replication protein DnaC